MIDMTGVPTWQIATIVIALGIAGMFGVHWLLDRLAEPRAEDDDDYDRWIA